MKYEVAITQTENGLQSNANRILELVKGPEYKKYNYVVTADNCKDAIVDKKSLKKEYESAKRKRIDFRNKLLDDWKPIEETFMEAEKVVNKYIEELDAGIKAIEAQEKKEKQKAIHAYYIENLNELQVPFDIVMDEKWLNKSCKKKDWQDAIKKTIANYELEYSLLERSDVEDKELLKSIFMDVWDRNEAFVKYDAQMAAKKRAEKMREEKEAREQANLKIPEEDKAQRQKEDENLKLDKASISDIKIPIETGIMRPNIEKKVNEMVSIKGSEEVYKKVKSHALLRGLVWEEL